MLWTKFFSSSPPTPDALWIGGELLNSSISFVDSFHLFYISHSSSLSPLLSSCSVDYPNTMTQHHSFLYFTSLHPTYITSALIYIIAFISYPCSHDSILVTSDVSYSHTGFYLQPIFDAETVVSGLLNSLLYFCLVSIVQLLSPHLPSCNFTTLMHHSTVFVSFPVESCYFQSRI